MRRLSGPRRNRATTTRGCARRARPPGGGFRRPMASDRRSEPAPEPLLAHHDRGLHESAEAVAEVLADLGIGRPAAEDRLVLRSGEAPPCERPLVVLGG